MNNFSLICISIQLGLLVFIWVSMFQLKKTKRRIIFEADKAIKLICEAESALDEVAKFLDEREKDR